MNTEDITGAHSTEHFLNCLFRHIIVRDYKIRISKFAR